MSPLGAGRGSWSCSMSGVDEPELEAVGGGLRCGARKKRGAGQCGAYAVRGSDPPRCRMHFGKSVDAFKAERDLAERAARVLEGLGHAPAIGDPLTELLAAAAEAKQW